MWEKYVVICKAGRRSLKPFLITIRNQVGDLAIRPTVLATLVAQDLLWILYYS